MLILCVFACALGSDTWHPHCSEMFRANPTGPPNHIAVLTWFGSTKRTFSSHSPGALMLDLYTWPGDGPKQLVTSTKVGESRIVETFTTHFYLRKASGAIDFGHTFLAALLNGGQHSRLVVWEFDWHTLRPIEMLDVLHGDPAKLEYGIVTENSPANYVNRDEWPKGVKKISDYISRDWTIGSGSLWEFVPGPWRLTTDPRFTGEPVR